MKRTVLALVAVGLFSSSASADKKTWGAVAIGAGVFTLASGGFTMYEVDQTNKTEQQLCDLGFTVPRRCTQSNWPRGTPAQLDELNQQGDQAAVKARIGYGATALGLGVTAFAIYKYITSEDDKPEPAVVVAPVIARDGGGVAAQLRF